MMLLMKSFAKVKTWRDDFLLNSNVSNPESFPFVILANKMDVDDSKKQVTTKQANDLINELSNGSSGAGDDNGSATKKTYHYSLQVLRRFETLNSVFKEAARKAATKSVSIIHNV